MRALPTMDRERRRAFANSLLALIFSVLSFGFIVFVFTLAIVGIVRAGDGKPKDVFGHEDPISDQRFGIGQVSGFYGPGSWAAWLFTVGSCAMDRAFGKEAPLDARRRI